MDLDLEKVATRIKKLRETHGISQEALAQKAGLSKNHVSLIERMAAGENIGVGTLNSIAHAFEVPIEYILFGEFYAPNTAQYEEIRSKIMTGNHLLPLTKEEEELLFNFRAVENKKERATIKDIVKSWGSRNK